MCIYVFRKPLLFVFILVSLVAKSFAGEDPTKPVFVLSHDEFVLQRTAMIDDLGEKIELMQQARVCAEKAATAQEFQACNQVFQDAIRAHMAEQVARQAKKN